MSLKAKIKQYGFKNSLKRAAKSLLRRIGIQYESFYLMVNHIDQDDLKQKMERYDYSDVKELTYNDFKLGDPSVFTPEKMELIKSRYETGKYWAYGLVENNILAYSCWISLSQINFPEKYQTNIKLDNNQGFLEDAYCHPAFRGKGLHSKMNLFRIHQLNKKNKREIFVVLVKDNIPALKSQLKSGFQISKQMSFLKIFGKLYTFEKVMQ